MAFRSKFFIIPKSQNFRPPASLLEGIRHRNSKDAAGDIDQSFYPVLSVGSLTPDFIADFSLGGSLDFSQFPIGSTAIKDDSIKTQHLLANAVTTSKIVAGTITSLLIKAGAIVTSKIAAGTITGLLIKALAIESDKIAANAIVTSKIAAGTITGALIKALAIGADQIAANAITTSKITAGTITGDRIKALNIDSAQIAAGAITTSKITAGTITGNLIKALAIDSTLIAANAITTSKIAAGTITGALIKAGAITTDKLTVGSLSAISINTGSLNVTNYIRSNSYIAGSAGYKLAATTGLEVNSGSINGKVVKFGTLIGSDSAGSAASYPTTEADSDLSIAIVLPVASLVLITGHVDGNVGSANTTTCTLKLFYDSTQIQSTMSVAIASGSGGTDFVIPLNGYVSLAAGSYTIKLRWLASQSGAVSNSRSLTLVAFPN